MSRTLDPPEEGRRCATGTRRRRLAERRRLTAGSVFRHLRRAASQLLGL